MLTEKSELAVVGPKILIMLADTISYISDRTPNMTEECTKLNPYVASSNSLFGDAAPRRERDRF